MKIVVNLEKIVETSHTQAKIVDHIRTVFWILNRTILYKKASFWSVGIIERLGPGEYHSDGCNFRTQSGFKNTYEFMSRLNMHQNIMV